MANTEQLVKLATRDGVVIEASRAAACRCVTIQNMLEDAGGEDEATPQLPLALVDARPLRHVLEYCRIERGQDATLRAQLPVLLPLPLEELFELVAATNFLEMPQFFELTCGAVAEHIRRSTSAEAIRARFGITPDIPAAELKSTANEDPFTDDADPVGLSCSVSAALGTDVFEACLLQLDGAQLRKVKSVCLAWRSARAGSAAPSSGLHSTSRCESSSRCIAHLPHTCTAHRPPHHACLTPHLGPPRCSAAAKAIRARGGCPRGSKACASKLR